MKKLLFFAFAGVLLYSCSSSKPKTDAPADQAQQKTIEITNDLENASAVIPSWINEKTVVSMKDPAAHSGEFACLTDANAEYSYAYQELVKNINTGIPKRVVIKGWAYTTVASPKLGLIANISEAGKQIDWKVSPLTDDLKETGKWVEFSKDYYLTNTALTPETEIRIFAWNQSKQAIYFDDLIITFEY